MVSSQPLALVSQNECDLQNDAVLVDFFSLLTVTFWSATKAPVISLSDLDARSIPFSTASSNDLDDEQMISVTFATELDLYILPFG